MMLSQHEDVPCGVVQVAVSLWPLHRDVGKEGLDALLFPRCLATLPAVASELLPWQPPLPSQQGPSHPEPAKTRNGMFYISEHPDVVSAERRSPRGSSANHSPTVVRPDKSVPPNAASWL